MPANTQSLREFSRRFCSGIFEGFLHGFWKGVAEVVAQGLAMLEKPPAVIMPTTSKCRTANRRRNHCSRLVYVECGGLGLLFCTVGPSRMTSWNLKVSTGVCVTRPKYSNEVYGRGVRNCERHDAQGTSMATSCAHACRAAQNLFCWTSPPQAFVLQRFGCDILGLQSCVIFRRPLKST